MKKIYIIPTLQVVRVQQTRNMMLINESEFNENLDNSSNHDGSNALIKGNTSSNYNVWDDDWSKN